MLSRSRVESGDGRVAEGGVVPVMVVEVQPVVQRGDAFGVRGVAADGQFVEQRCGLPHRGGSFAFGAWSEDPPGGRSMRCRRRQRELEEP